MMGDVDSDLVEHGDRLGADRRRSGARRRDPHTGGRERSGNALGELAARGVCDA
jgi:hypothetical protein